MKILAIGAIIAACFPVQQSESSPSVGSAPSELLSASRVDGLSEAARIVIATNYVLNLDPGVSAKKTNESLVLSTYDGAKIRIGTGADMIRLPSPVVARLTPAGWDLGMGKTSSASALYMSRDVQDDTDTNLKSMQESARKLKSKTDNNQDNKAPGKKLKVRWLYGENPNPTAELFNTPAIQQLTHISAIGF